MTMLSEDDLLEKDKFEENELIELENNLIGIWKSIPQDIETPTDIDVKIGDGNYPESVNTMAYLILHYLVNKDCPEIAKIFINEFNQGKTDLHRKYENLLEFDSIKREAISGDMRRVETFLRDNTVTERLWYLLNCYKVLQHIKTGNSQEALNMCLSVLDRHNKSLKLESKHILKYLVSKVGIDEEMKHIQSSLLHLFSLEYCRIHGLAPKCYLEKLFETGTSAFAQISRHKNILFDPEDPVIPIEIKLDKSGYYHTSFVCPILKTLCYDDNIPTMLECGHVISLDALHVLTNGGSLATFKCPYCPKVSRSCQVVKLKLY